MVADSSTPGSSPDAFVVGVEVVLGLIVLAFLAYVVYRGVAASRRGESVWRAVLKGMAVGLPAAVATTGGILILVLLVTIFTVMVVILAVSGASNVQSNHAVGVILFGIALAMLLVLWSVVYAFVMALRRLVRGRRRRSLEPPG